ncbi:acyltransferase [Epilithonimonas sp. UC225_85]|uniref:acyltransferase n=1 Tax=Epilithonimonas sp. UC225_85 TaxID=3350167 RepID=UPI0036D235DE
MHNRLITKLFSEIEKLKWKSYYNTCKKNGLQLGEGVSLQNGINFGSEPFLIEIGNFCRISSSVLFVTHSGGSTIMKKVEGYDDVRVFGRIKVGDNTFIGANSTITYNVSIGNNCIITIGAVVNNSIPDNSVYGGIPARYICSTQEYYERKKTESVDYPRDLEKNRKKLNTFLRNNLFSKYKPVKKMFRLMIPFVFNFVNI